MEKNSLSTTDKILQQSYVTAKDLQVLIPRLGYVRALKYIDAIREEMGKNGFFVPDGRTKVALTKLVKKKFGL